MSTSVTVAPPAVLPVRDPSPSDSRRRKAQRFLSPDFTAVADSPNGHPWFHSMPLPDGRRIKGADGDLNREGKLWASCFGGSPDCLSGKRVLDVGANDGFFTIAALLSGAASAHAVNTGDLITQSFPYNVTWASRAWGVSPSVTVADFLGFAPNGRQYDVILFFGVMYHLENMHAGVRSLARLLAPGGSVFLETQTTSIDSPRPLLELATDDGQSTVPQFRSALHTVGNSNLMLPNPAAVVALADMYGLVAAPLRAGNPYEAERGGVGQRRVFVLTHAADNRRSPARARAR